MSAVTGGNVWDFAAEEKEISISKASRIFNWVKWVLCVAPIAFGPALTLAFFDFEVWNTVPTNLKPVAGGFVVTERFTMSLLNFGFYVATIIGSIIGVHFVNRKLLRGSTLFTGLLIFAFVVMVSINDNDKSTTTSFETWAQETYGYTKVYGGKPELSANAVNVLKADGVQTVANILRSDGNIYLYENVVQEEELIKKIKEAKGIQP